MEKTSNDRETRVPREVAFWKDHRLVLFTGQKVSRD